MMLTFLKNKKGQSLLEYSLILGAIIVGILFMQLYVRRAIEGRLRGAADDIGEQYSATGTFNFVTNRTSNIEEVTDATGQVTTTYHEDETVRTGNETMPAANEEYWEF